jgi:hypothetical protein
MSKSSPKSRKTASKSVLVRTVERITQHSTLKLVVFVSIFVSIGVSGWFVLVTHANNLPRVASCSNSPYEKIWSKSSCVKTLQTFLHESLDLGYPYYGDSKRAKVYSRISSCPGSVSKPIGRDGVFGPQTQYYLECYQRLITAHAKSVGISQAQLSIDGVAGPSTWSRIRADVSNWQSYYDNYGVYAY